MSTELLGEIVTWDMASSTCEYQKVIDSLNAAGLPTEVAKELQANTAFSRACKDLKKDRVIDKIKKRKGGVVTFQFTHKKVENDRLEHSYEAQMELDTDSGDLSCAEKPELAEEARKLFAFAMQTRNASDITRMVQKLFEQNADLYPINPRKGVAYFVPDQHSVFTEKVEKFLTSLGGRLSRFPVPKGTAAGNASVRDAVQAGLSVLLDELQSAVEGFGEDTRQTTMENAQKKWDVINHKINVYAEYLESEQQGLQDRLKQAREQLVKKISEAAEKHSESSDASAA